MKVMAPKLKAKQRQKWEVGMSTTLQYGRERAYLGRSLLNFMHIVRDAHAPDLTLGEIGDLLFTTLEVFIGHAFERRWP